MNRDLSWEKYKTKSKARLERDLKSSEHRLYSVLAGEDSTLERMYTSDLNNVFSIFLHDANESFTKF